MKEKHLAAQGFVEYLLLLLLLAASTALALRLSGVSLRGAYQRGGRCFSTHCHPYRNVGYHANPDADGHANRIHHKGGNGDADRFQTDRNRTQTGGDRTAPAESLCFG